MAPGRLLAFEGIDGCGKSTQARAVAEALGARLTHEPGATALGTALRRLLLAPDAPPVTLRAEALLMAADRAEHIELVVAPALAAGGWVVSDRFSGSTLAYQGYGRGLAVDELARVVAWGTGGLVPDLSILVDVPVEVAQARLAPSVPDRLERLGPAFAQRVRDGFLSLAAADSERWVVVDGRAEAGELTARIVDEVRQRLGDPGDGAVTGADAVTGPVASLFHEVVGQEAAVATLRVSAAHPVHAYLFVGPAGNGGLAAAHGFAAALLCPDGGCGVCPTCRRALAGTDPDLHMVHRRGAFLTVDDMRELVGLAARHPLQSARQVVVVTEVHLGGRAAPALLKTLEEPPGPTVFILLADDVTPELATVASRCAVIAFPPVPRGTLVQWLVERGAPGDLAAVVADGSGGDPRRAQLMVDDPDVAERAALWSSVPDRLTGSGAEAAALATQLLEYTDRAVAPLRAAHASEMARLTDQAKELGHRGLPGRKEITDHHTREERRWRTDALRAGLGVLARAYRDRAVAVSGDRATASELHARSAVQAVGLITEATRSLPRNPQESLLLQALLVRLGTLAV